MANNNNKSVKNNGIYMFADFTKGLYLLDTPRSLGEQLASLALVDGRNVWAERGALVPQYGYLSLAKIPDGERVIAYTEGSTSNDGFCILTVSGRVFFYSVAQGLKEYKTTVTGGFTKPIVARRDNDLVIYDDGQTYLFGNRYEEGTKVAVNKNVTCLDFGSYYQFTIDEESLKYYWVGKNILANDTVVIISSVDQVEHDDGTKATYIRAYSENNNHESLPDTVTLYEQTLYSFTLNYTPEDTAVSATTLEPILMAVSQNRLFIVHITGDIYYSAIGVIDDFNEKNGAGYFGGFYNDVSAILSIEDFLNGTLICRKNGLYILTIGDIVEIDKISQAGQEYASDHVIVGEKVYAYDSNSGALVVAVQQNVFGYLTAGKTLVASEYLNVSNFNINSTKRALTYNHEQNMFSLYYGEQLDRAIIYTANQSLFPRELDKNLIGFIGLNQGVVGITELGEIIQDFKRGTIIPTLSCIAAFEPIGLRDNRLIQCTLMDVTELSGVDYQLSTQNATISHQKIVPSYYTQNGGDTLLPFTYSDNIVKENSFELQTRWAEQASNVTRVAAPMSGRNGVAITFEFEPGRAFCLSSIRLPDFAQGVS
ncbi:MAG: hypothetical protein NC218_08225 [Acetobacter sp.]|nr:hypothetical protein [Acetobacter sp.]